MFTVIENGTEHYLQHERKADSLPVRIRHVDLMYSVQVPAL